IQSQAHRLKVGAQTGRLGKYRRDRARTEQQRRFVMLRSQIDVLVLRLQAQVRRERIFDAATGRVADARGVLLVGSVEAEIVGEGVVMVDLAPGEAAGGVEQRAVPRKSDAGPN